MQTTPDPKPRKRLIDAPYLKWLTTKPCIYCNEPALEPHHDRTGYGDGKGATSTKPDDYRAIETCYRCHNALHGRDKKRLKWMTEKIGREDISRNMANQLALWGVKQGWDMGEIYAAVVDGIIDVVARERGM